MEQVAGTTDTFTFTVQQTPGTCGEACTDQYRLCVVNSSGFRVDRIVVRVRAYPLAGNDGAGRQLAGGLAGSGGRGL